MRLGFYMGYAQPGTNPLELIELAQEAERLGYDSAWAAEAWGTDAVTVLSWLAATTSTIKVGSAILQMPGRTPALTAMTAATLDLLSGGRLLLGLGPSGPQVVEGWHGQPWGKPLAKTREYVEIVRTVLRRETLEHHGPHYDIPYTGPGATGLGKPLKVLGRPLRADLPIYLSPERFDDVYRPHLARARKDFEIVAGAEIVVGDDVQACRDVVKQSLALYVGGMGARGRNFYNALVCRYGYEREAAEVQELYLGGKKREAVAAVPDALVDEVALVGPRERIAARLDAWRDCGVTTLLCQTRDVETIRMMAELAA